MEQPIARHPAAEWALTQHFSPEEVACTTAVVLKILDGKCKMIEGEKRAVVAIYEAILDQPCSLFDSETHRIIATARSGAPEVAARIHELRLYAEAQIPRPVMKGYKARLREGLFG